MKQNNEIVLWIEESEQLQAEHQATNSGAASPITLLFICRPAARRQNEEKIVVGGSALPCSSFTKEKIFHLVNGMSCGEEKENNLFSSSLMGPPTHQEERDCLFFFNQINSCGARLPFSLWIVGYKLPLILPFPFIKFIPSFDSSPLPANFSCPRRRRQPFS